MFHKIESDVGSEMDSAIELALIDSPDAVDMDSCKARNAVFLKPCNAIRIGFDV